MCATGPAAALAGPCGCTLRPELRDPEKATFRLRFTSPAPMAGWRGARHSAAAALGRSRTRRPLAATRPTIAPSAPSATSRTSTTRTARFRRGRLQRRHRPPQRHLRPALGRPEPRPLPRAAARDEVSFKVNTRSVLRHSRGAPPGRKYDSIYIAYIPTVNPRKYYTHGVHGNMQHAALAAHELLSCRGAIVVPHSHVAQPAARIRELLSLCDALPHSSTTSHDHIPLPPTP